MDSKGRIPNFKEHINNPENIILNKEINAKSITTKWVFVVKRKSHRYELRAGSVNIDNIQSVICHD